MRKGERERGSVEAYMFLLPPRAPIPTTKSAAEDLEAAVLAWMIDGRTDPPRPEGPRPKPKPAPAGESSSTGEASSAPEPEAGEGESSALVTFGDAVRAFALAYLKGSSDKGAPSILRRLEREFDKRPIAAVFDRRLAREFLDEIEEESSHVNANRHRAKWMSLIVFLRTEYKIAGDSPFYDKRTNPTGIKKREEGAGRRRRLGVFELEDGSTIAEEEAILEAASALNDGGMMLGRIYCAIDAGLRRGEMLKLRRADVLRNYQKTGVTMLRIRWTTAKTKRERLVPVVTDRLLAFLETRAFKDFPFGQADGTRLEAFRDDWEAILLASGLEAGEWSAGRTTRHGNTWRQWIRTRDADLHWHDLRHECGSRLAERGVPLIEIMELLGHANLATTQKYLNPQLASLARNMKRALAPAASSTAARSTAQAVLEQALGREAAAALLAAIVSKHA